MVPRLVPDRVHGPLRRLASTKWYNHRLAPVWTGRLKAVAPSYRMSARQLPITFASRCCVQPWGASCSTSVPVEMRSGKSRRQSRGAYVGGLRRHQQVHQDRLRPTAAFVGTADSCVQSSPLSRARWQAGHSAPRRMPDLNQTGTRRFSHD